MFLKKYHCLVFFTFIFLLSCKKSTPNILVLTATDTTIRAADLSFFPEIDSAGTAYYNLNKQKQPLLQILKDQGCNTIRIRLWVNPANKHSSFSEVKYWSNIYKQYNFKIWLTLHYSDSWADPSQQTIPSQWLALNFNQLKDTVEQYTFMVVSQIHPDIIQIGNEINQGLLWGKGDFSNPKAMSQLLQSGIAGAKRADSTCKTMIHIAGYNEAFNFFDVLKQNNVVYDYMGLSYYPMWHGKSLDSLQDALKQLYTSFKKPICIAETAYPFTLGWNDYTHNILGLNTQLIPIFPATEQGQFQYLQAFKQKLKQTAGCIGFCYWAPEWVAYKGPTSTTGSSWENQCLFDFNNNALLGIQCFNP